MASIDGTKSDIEVILSHRFDLSRDIWKTSDKRFHKGSPFSIFESVLYLLELGIKPEDPLLKQCAELIFSVWQPDGRFKTYPTGTIFPCQTATALQSLCHLGYASDERLSVTFDHLLDIQQPDGGWRCNKFSFGHGPETASSNPGPTLTVLKCARSDRRILEAYQLLESKLVDGRVVVQRVVPKLANLNFCMKGEPSKHATKIFHAIQANLLL